MQDRPTARELIEAVAQFLNGEIAPTLNDPRLRFRTLVAVNVLNVVARELAMGEEQGRGEYARLRELFEREGWGEGETESKGEGETEDWRGQVAAMTRELAARIRAGEADEGAFHDAVFAHVERTVIEKLEIANPRYLERRGG